MKQNVIFIAAGAAWGAVLGVTAFIHAGRLAAGFAWLFLFGDDPWPEWAGAAIIGIAAATAMAVFAACVALGIAGKRRYAGTDGPSARRARAFAAALLAFALLSGGAGLLMYLQREAAVDRRQQEDDSAVRAFRELAATMHRFAEIEIHWPGGGIDGFAMIHIMGRRTGDYVLAWGVRDRSFDRIVLSGRRQLHLTTDPVYLRVDIAADGLVDGYRRLLSRPDANLMVEEAFTLKARLIPVLDEAAVAALPNGEARNLEQARSDLIDETAAEFPVRFFLYDGELNWEAR